MPTLLERVEQLENKVERLISRAEQPVANGKWWKQWSGAFRDSPDFDSAMERGREYRQSQPLASELPEDDVDA